MFDLGWSKLIIIAMLAIVVVGPKDLPALLRTIGKFVSQIRRQADEFRRQFDEAMRDTELDQIRKDVEEIKSSTEATVRDIGRSAEDSVKPLEAAASEITEMGKISEMGNGALPDAKTADTFMPESTTHASSSSTAPELPANPSSTSVSASTSAVAEAIELPPAPALPTTAPSMPKAGAA